MEFDGPVRSLFQETMAARIWGGVQGAERNGQIGERFGNGIDRAWDGLGVELGSERHRFRHPRLSVPSPSLLAASQPPLGHRSRVIRLRTTARILVPSKPDSWEQGQREALFF